MAPQALPQLVLLAWRARQVLLVLVVLLRPAFPKRQVELWAPLTVSRDSPQACRPGVDEAAAFPQNRWS